MRIVFFFVAYHGSDHGDPWVTMTARGTSHGLRATGWDGMPNGRLRPWRCNSTWHRCTHRTCSGTCHGRSRQYHGTRHGNPEGVECHGKTWNCRELQWNAMALPWLGMDTAVWHCHALSQKDNDSAAAKVKMRAMHCSSVFRATTLV